MFNMTLFLKDLRGMCLMLSSRLQRVYTVHVFNNESDNVSLSPSLVIWGHSKDVIQ